MKPEDNMPQCGSWRLVREIGHGAYGVVYLAEDGEGERAAVKVCRRDAIGEERYARELRGARLYQSVSDPEGLVRMRKLVENDWGFYSVMDLADDEFDRADATPEAYRPKTLAKVIEGEKALPLKESVDLAISLAKGLAVLQRHHLLHRDIKPANVLYVGGLPVLSDPGLLVEESVAVSTVGTPGYLPPERKFTDAAGDIYSLGLTLKAASFGRKIEEIEKGPALEADTGAPLFPAWWKILNKATDPVPSRRYQSAKALLRDLKPLAIRLFFSARNSWKSRIALFFVKLFLVALVFATSVLITKWFVLRRDERKNEDRWNMERKAFEERNAAQTAIYERALRDTFGDVLSEERIKEKAQKAAAGEAVALTPAETDAFKKNFGLDKLTEDLKNSLPARESK